MLIRILFLVLSFIYLFPQPKEKVIARVGDYRIYESEFKERFDFSAHPKLLNENDKQTAKYEFLKQLIAEKLLSLEAKEKGLNDSELFTDIITPLENIFIRDALYNLEIKNKVSYSIDEINEGIDRIKKILKINFMYSSDREELQKINNQLIAGASFDSLLALRPEVKDQPREITFGTMDKSVEDVVYNLKTDEFTTPVESKDGYYILKFIDASPNPDLKNSEVVIEDVKRIVETRAEFKNYLHYYHKFFSEHKVTADKEIFEELVKIFKPKFEEKYSLQNSESNGGKYFLRGGELSSVLQLINSDLHNKIFIKLSENPIRVKYFLNQLSQDGFYVQDLSELSISASLSSYIRKFIEDQLLTIEGNKKGLNKSYDVTKYLNMWEDSYLSKMMMVNMFDSVKVSEEEAYSVYKQNDWKSDPPELVNIAEVLSDSLEVIEIVLNELSNGKSIQELARQYTKRDSLKDRGGEFGFFSPAEYGDIGKIASQMEIDDVYGPIKLDEGYSIFQLIDRKQDTASYTKSFDETREQLISHLTLMKFEKYVNEYNARLANKYGVEIYDDALKGTDNIFMNLVVVRYMGFGGEIFAVPYTEQYSGWYDVWQKSKFLNP